MGSALDTGGVGSNKRQISKNSESGRLATPRPACAGVRQATVKLLFVNYCSVEWEKGILAADGTRIEHGWKFTAEAQRDRREKAQTRNSGRLPRLQLGFQAVIVRGRGGRFIFQSKSVSAAVVDCRGRPGDSFRRVSLFAA